MTGDTVKVDWPSLGVGQEVGRFDQLLECRARTTHGNDDPLHAGFSHNLFLIHILGIIAIDSR